MFPAQTSFIPITVAVTKWVEANGFGGNYPYWYLGTTPVKYLMGPVVPGILVLLHKLLLNLSFFDLSFLLLIASYLLQAIGWGFLAFKLSGRKSVGWWVFALSLVLPFTIFYSFAFGEVSGVFASALTPWALVAYATVKSEKWKVKSFLTSISITILFLTNTTASIPAIVGILILGLIKDKNWEKGLKNALTVIIAGWFLSLFWYGPGYWLIIWGAPSFGGRSAAFSLVWVFNLLRGFAPFFLALLVIFWRVKKRNIFEKFALSWFLAFGFLTLVRFVANPAFWLDWTAWISEMEIGMALLLGYFFARLSNASVLRPAKPDSDTLALWARLGFTRSKASSPRNDSSGGVYPSTTATRDANFQFLNIINSLKISNFPSISLRASKFKINVPTIIYLLFTIYLLSGWVLAWQKRDLWLPRREISQSVEYKVASKLEQETRNWKLETGNEPTVFLSGTSAFWLNSFYDILQVRGGRDEVSQYSGWREAAWEIRSGTSSEESLAALRGLGVRFLVVHTGKSQEYYHDFENTAKFENVDGFDKVWERSGDVIYRIGY